MNKYLESIILDYNQVYTNYPKYRYFYFDILNKNLKENTTVVYPHYDEETKQSILYLGKIKLKDYSFVDVQNGIEVNVTLKSVPFIQTNNGSLVLNVNKNCASI